MKLTKFDIGAEIISIITKGMYPDPKDALREYIQNAVDAQAKNLSVKIRQESIVVEDDGIGMNRDILRKAVRIGISDKNPTKDVGFMGIGIYSSFHLCDKITIFSRGSDNIPNKLEMDFGKMKSILEEQKEKKNNGSISSEDLIDLQSLLETCIFLTENNGLSNEEFPVHGTRVELSEIEKEFYSALSNFEKVATYLRGVIPLHYDKKNFKYAEEIERKIQEICEQKNQKFEIINLKLQVNSKSETLYRPYKNIDFHKKKTPLPPEFFNIESNGEFFGVAWGCLNSVRRKLDNRELRGFILKKQGFSVGERKELVKFFPRGNTFFDRYSGEIIIVNSKILPNASRNDIEYSPLRSSFYEALTNVANKYDDRGNTFQEHSRGDEDLSELQKQLKKEIGIGTYNEFEEDTGKLIDKIVILKGIEDKLTGRINRKGFSDESQPKAKALIKQVEEFEKTIQLRIKSLTAKKTKKQPSEKATSPVEIAKNIADINVTNTSEPKNYENLYDLLLDLDFTISDDLKDVIFLLDEKFIQQTANTKAEYNKLLISLSEDIQDKN